MIPELTDAQREVQALVREFCQREVAPHTAEWDAGHHVPLDTLRALAELGVLGVTIPEEHGGAGLDHTTLCLVVEELARHDPGLSVAVAVHAGLTVAPIKSHGTPEQQARLLPPLASGEQLGCYALPSRTRARTPPASACAPSATVTTGCCTGRRPGSRTAASPTP